MRLSRKIQKLFSLDAVQSLWEHICRWSHPVNARRILATIDQAELERLRKHYPYRPNARRINAYEDAAYWIGVNIKHVQDLWLDRALIGKEYAGWAAFDDGRSDRAAINVG